VITLTTAAAQQILAAARASGPGRPALRVAARRGPDGSLEFGLGFDEAREGDVTIEQDGIELLVGLPSQELLEGTTIDFVEIEPGELRFIFLAAGPPAAAEGGACGGGSGCGGGQ
jgi:iron-sulfur cluster assembly protein